LQEEEDFPFTNDMSGLRKWLEQDSAVGRRDEVFRCEQKKNVT
jgi:hypothetical protein